MKSGSFKMKAITAKQFLLILIFLFAIFLPSPGKAYNILFYYLGCDSLGLGPTLLKAVTVLQNAGNTVTVINADAGVTPPGCYSSTSPAGVYDPTADTWIGYDQVWDCRFYPDNSEWCYASPFTYHNDYFSPQWQAKAQDYIQNHCGNFFLNGENSGFASRNLGNSVFISNIGAVTGGFIDCPTNTVNSSDVAAGGLIASSLSGAVSFFCDQVGGIPLVDLNGTSFAQIPAGQWGTAATRSVASGWSGSTQMTALTGSNVGKLVLVWDTTMWDGGDFVGNNATVTTTFFQSVAAWLGASTCITPTPTPTPPVTFTPTMTWTPTPAVPTSTFTPSSTFTITATPTLTATFTPVSTSTPTFTPTLTLTPVNTPTPVPTATPTPSLHVWPNPFNPGNSIAGVLKAYYLPVSATMSIYTIAGELVVKLSTGNCPPSLTVVNSANAICWDGKNKNQVLVSTGTYYYVIQNSGSVLLTGKLLVLTGK